MSREDGLDFVGVHLETGHRDHVFLAVDDAGVALFVHDADVAGTKKAVGSHATPGFFGLLPIAQHDLRPADADLAAFTTRHRLALSLETGHVYRKSVV